MTVTGLLYGQVLESIFGKNLDWDNDVIKVALLLNHTVNQDDHDFFNDVSGDEITGTGYSAGGETLVNKTVTTSAYTGGTNIFALDADDTTWTTSTLTADTAIVYDSSPGSDATNILICSQKSSTSIATTAGTFSIAWHADGIVKITVGS